MENKAAEAAEWAAIVQVEAIIITSGAEVVSAQTLSLGRSSPQALARLWPHAAPRTSGMKMSAGWQTAVLSKYDPRLVQS